MTLDAATCRYAARRAAARAKSFGGKDGYWAHSLWKQEAAFWTDMAAIAKTKADQAKRKARR